MTTRGTQESVQTVRWPYKLIIFLIEHFESPTEVQLNSFVKVSWPFINKQLENKGSLKLFIMPL